MFSVKNRGYPPKCGQPLIADKHITGGHCMISFTNISSATKTGKK